MNIPTIDLFILTMLDRGAQSAYDLHRMAGISLGASTPSFARLLDQKYVTRAKANSGSKRLRYAFLLTASGRNAARNGWKELVNSGFRLFDLESTLRIVDMAVHYGAQTRVIRSFLRHAGTERLRLSDQGDIDGRSTSKAAYLTYQLLKARCESKRLRGEAEVLFTAAESLKPGTITRRASAAPSLIRGRLAQKA